MKAKITLAESATIHPDGTVSMLRAGITRVWARELPIRFQGSLVVRIEAEAAERGPHAMELQCIDLDGKDRLPPIKAQFTFPEGGGDQTMVTGMQSNLEEFGLYQFNVLVDKNLLDSWNLKVIELKETPNAS